MQLSGFCQASTVRPGTVYPDALPESLLRLHRVHLTLLSYLTLHICFRMQGPVVRFDVLPIDGGLALGFKLSLKDRQAVLKVVYLFQESLVLVYTQNTGRPPGVADHLIHFALGDVPQELAKVSFRPRQLYGIWPNHRVYQLWTLHPCGTIIL